MHWTTSIRWAPVRFWGRISTEQSRLHAKRSDQWQAEGQRSLLFQKLRKSRRMMKALQLWIESEAEKLDEDFLRDRIHDLSTIVKTIEKNKGRQCKHWGDIFTLYIFINFEKFFFSSVDAFCVFPVKWLHENFVACSGRYELLKFQVWAKNNVRNKS